MLSGKVKFFEEKKGWGFITPDDGSEELFVHFSAIQADGFKKLQKGDMVTYEIGQNDKGACAVNVKKVG